MVTQWAIGGAQNMLRVTSDFRDLAPLPPPLPPVLFASQYRRNKYLLQRPRPPPSIVTLGKQRGKQCRFSCLLHFISFLPTRIEMFLAWEIFVWTFRGTLKLPDSTLGALSHPRSRCVAHTCSRLHFSQPRFQPRYSARSALVVP